MQDNVVAVAYSLVIATSRMEKDAEMHGEGNSYTTDFRQYDPRLGRWLSLDPMMTKYPEISPYVALVATLVQ